MKSEAKLFVVTWVNAGQRRVRIFHHSVDADAWSERLRAMDHISEVEGMDALVHDVVVAEDVL